VYWRPPQKRCNTRNAGLSSSIFIFMMCTGAPKRIEIEAGVERRFVRQGTLGQLLAVIVGAELRTSIVSAANGCLHAGLQEPTTGIEARPLAQITSFEVSI
jgi:hypothetical protein